MRDADKSTRDQVLAGLVLVAANCRVLCSTEDKGVPCDIDSPYRALGGVLPERD